MDQVKTKLLLLARLFKEEHISEEEFELLFDQTFIVQPQVFQGYNQPYTSPYLNPNPYTYTTTGKI